MKLLRTGVILNTENYESCVIFYRDLLGLQVLFSKTEAEDRLTCFDFGGAYLMVETGGFANASGKSIKEGCAKLRLNVDNLEAARQHLIAHGVAAEITSFPWGSTINIHDPDGNRIGIREEREFSEQLRQP
ncbi:MAG: VOC family protein [Gammaproteobacteria bacterium]